MENDMKRFILIAILLLAITGCGSKDDKKIAPGTTGAESNIKISKQDVVLDIAKDTLTNTEAIFTVTNNTDNTVYILDNFEIEMQKNSTWYKLKLLEPMMLAFAACSLETEEVRTMKLSWEPWYGNLPKGKYRFLFKISTQNDYSDSFYIAKEFTI